MSDVMLRADHISVWFGGLHALEDISCAVTTGEVVGIIGPNGAGKSTLLNVLSGAQPATNGRVYLGDVDVSRYSVVRRARCGLARTFQRAGNFSELTVIEHLILGYACGLANAQSSRLGWYSRRRVYEMAQKDTSPLSPFALVKRLGLDALQDALAASLPLGSARLVDLGRAVCARPRILLLDEPVSGLDSSVSQAVAVLLRELASDDGIGILVVEHDLDFTQSAADRVIALDFGRELVSGSPGEVLNSIELRTAYLGSTAHARSAPAHPGEVQTS